MTLTLPESNNPVPATPKSKGKPTPPSIFSPSKALANWNVLTTFSSEDASDPASEAHLFCALEMSGNDVIFGTSHGIYRSAGCGDEAQRLERGPESVFQMALVEDLNEVIAIAGEEQQLKEYIKEFMGRTSSRQYVHICKYFASQLLFCTTIERRLMESKANLLIHILY